MSDPRTNTKETKRRTLHVAFCANDTYVPYMCVALRGIAINHRGNFDIVVHILTDGISPANEKLIGEALDINSNSSISYIIHVVDDTPLKGLKTRHYTIYTWYRMLIPDLLPDVDKILYLDTDVAVNESLEEILDYDISAHSIATAPDTDSFTDAPFERCGYPRHLGYVCVGVMLMNLDYWRQNDIAAKVIACGHENHDRIKYPDQDSINYVCRDSKGYLPLRWGVTRSLFTTDTFYTPSNKESMYDCLYRPAIVHYAGCAPWLRESDHPLLDIWTQYNDTLRHKAPRHYATKGLMQLKLRLWDMLHPEGRRALTRDEILRRINNIEEDPQSPGPARQILIFIESLQCGGAEKSLVSLLQLLDPRYCKIDLMVLRRDGLFMQYVPKWVHIIDFPGAPQSLSYKIRQYAYAIKWRALGALGIRRHNAETRWGIIGSVLRSPQQRYHAAIAYQQGLPTYYIATKVDADAKYAWVNIDLRGAGYREKFNRRYYDSYRRINAVSTELFDWLAESSYVDSDRLVNIYDILNVDLIRTMSEDADIAPRVPGKLHLVTVGRLSRQKNYPLAVEAARLLRDKGIDFVWDFVGEGAERPSIEALIEKYNLGEQVRLAGEQGNPYKYMRRADIYVHTASFEGFGLTIAEAKILGLPVVSTDFRIVYDQLTDGENGLIATMHPESVASKIEMLVNDDTLRRRLIEAVKKESNTTAVTEVEKFNNLIFGKA